jgi:hypothetical protein
VALAAVSAVVVAALAIVPRRAAQQWAGLFMAAAAGVTYGYMSAATSLSWRIVHHGVLHALASWGPYAVVVSGLVGMVCTQSAFSAGMLRLSLPTMTVVQPLVAVAIGLTVLTEPVGRAGLDPLWEALGLAATVVGVYALAQPEFGD